MSIDIRKLHSMSLTDAQQVADDLAADLAQKFNIEYGWDGDTIVFERVGVDGEIDINDNCVHVRAELSYLLSFLEPAVEREIHRYLDEHFTTG